MGDCSNNMKPTTKKSGDNVLVSLPPRKEKKYAAPKDDSYADYIARADTKLQELITIKTRDLNTEKGSEVPNTLKLGNFKTQQFHLDSIIYLLSEIPQAVPSTSMMSTLLGNILKRKRDKSTTVELYANSIGKAYPSLTKLIEDATKKKDKHLFSLETQMFHLDAIVELMYAYDEIK